MRTASLLLLLALASCGSPDGNDPTIVDGKVDSAASPAFVDVEEFLNAGDDAWQGLQRTLASNFADVCGDTFCGGDYANLTPLRLTCSIDRHQVLHACTYVFAGSYETVTPTTGTVHVHARTFACKVPVAGIPLDHFLAALTAPGATPALRRPLPGATASIYDALGGCL